MNIGSLVSIRLNTFGRHVLYDKPTCNFTRDPGYVGTVHHYDICILLDVEYSQLDCDEFSKILTSCGHMGWLQSRLIVKL